MSITALLVSGLIASSTILADEQDMKHVKKEMRVIIETNDQSDDIAEIMKRVEAEMGGEDGSATIVDENDSFNIEKLAGTEQFTLAAKNGVLHGIKRLDMMPTGPHFMTSTAHMIPPIMEPMSEKLQTVF